MDPGFNQAIELSAECLANVKLVQEKRLLQRYFDEISQDTGKYCFMVQDTLQVRPTLPYPDLPCHAMPYPTADLT